MSSEFLKHRTLSGALLAELREAILAGRYPAGTVMRQETLAEEFGVSRIPVRDVLQHLEAEGLVRSEPRRGAVVTGISRAEVSDVFELRAMIEPRLLRASLPRLTEEDFRSLEATQAAYVAAIEAEDKTRYGALNAEFHLGLYKRADMPRSEQILRGLLQASDRYTRVELSEPEDLFAARSEHAELIKLGRLGDLDAMLECLARHIGGVRESVDLHML